MIKNYIKTAWRNITANKLFASLNIAGLAIGICVCITLFMRFLRVEFRPHVQKLKEHLPRQRTVVCRIQFQGLGRTARRLRTAIRN